MFFGKILGITPNETEKPTTLKFKKKVYTLGEIEFEIDEPLDLRGRTFDVVEFDDIQTNYSITLRDATINELNIENSFFSGGFDLSGAKVGELNISLVGTSDSPLNFENIGLLEQIWELQGCGKIGILNMSFSGIFNIPKDYFHGKKISSLTLFPFSLPPNGFDLSNTHLGELAIGFKGTIEEPINIENTGFLKGILTSYRNREIQNLRLYFQGVLDIPVDFFKTIQCDYLGIESSKKHGHNFDFSGAVIGRLAVSIMGTSKEPIDEKDIEILSMIQNQKYLGIYQQLDIEFKGIIDCEIDMSCWKCGDIAFDGVQMNYPIGFNEGNFKSINIGDSNFSKGFDTYGAKIWEFHANSSIFNEYISFAKGRVSEVYINKCTINGEIVFHETSITSIVSLGESNIERCLFIDTILCPMNIQRPVIIDFQYGKYESVDFSPIFYSSITYGHTESKFSSVELWLVGARFELFVANNSILNTYLRSDREIKSINDNSDELYIKSDWDKMTPVKELLSYQRSRSREEDFFGNKQYLSSSKLQTILTRERIHDLEIFSNICLANDFKDLSDQSYYRMLQLKTSRKPFFSKLWDTVVLKWMFGWGIYIGRVPLAILVIVLIFTGILYIGPIEHMDFIGKIISPDNTTVTDSIFLVSSLSFTEKFMLSFQSFLGGFLFSDYGMVKGHIWLIALLKFEGLIGIFFIAIFTGLLANRFERK